MKIAMLIILNLAVLITLFSNSVRVLGVSLLFTVIILSGINFLYTENFQVPFFIIDVFVIVLGLVIYKTCEMNDVISHYKKRAPVKTFPMVILISGAWGMIATNAHRFDYSGWQKNIESEYAVMTLVSLILLFMLRKENG